MKNIEPILYPAECVSSCMDSRCPYIHRDLWKVGEEFFTYKEEAEKFIKKHNLMLDKRG